MTGRSDMKGPKTCEPSDAASALVKILRLGVEIMNLDPLTLPDMSLKVPTLGGIKLHNGSLSGLGTVRRTGPNYLKSDDGGLELHVEIGTGHLAINYTTTLSVLFMSVDVYIFVDVDSTCVTLLIKETSDAKLALESFKINSMQGIDVRLKALKLTDRAVNAILSTATAIFKGLIKGAAEVMLRDMVNKIIKMVNEQL
ncbi:hypothetical protein HPB49_025579 [Dermacentor silvarum]|uniref:Uncharacterized protein n=1 Tax=Dermacentor silvarum TaxID=543639 RepID=A0ACB8CTZ3_DERSI|nr:hypothetical protein HPB49_025579 [Dermacentor silvarum]